MEEGWRKLRGAIRSRRKGIGGKFWRKKVRKIKNCSRKGRIPYSTLTEKSGDIIFPSLEKNQIVIGSLMGQSHEKVGDKRKGQRGGWKGNSECAPHVERVK
jgi:hypothetical protein